MSLPPLDPAGAVTVTGAAGTVPAGLTAAPDFASLMPAGTEVAYEPALAPNPPGDRPPTALPVITLQEATGDAARKAGAGADLGRRVGGLLATGLNTAIAGVQALADIQPAGAELAMVAELSDSPTKVEADLVETAIGVDAYETQGGRSDEGKAVAVPIPAAPLVLLSGKLPPERMNLEQLKSSQPQEAGGSSSTGELAQLVGQPAPALTGSGADVPATGDAAQVADRTVMPAAVPATAAALPVSPQPSAASVSSPVQAAPSAAALSPRLSLSSDFGDRLGVAIARHVRSGREELTVRMDPAELGRIEVKLAFDDRGSLRAVVSADSATVVDTMRRDLGEITRALADAGVRSDGHSFRFERGSSDGGSSPGGGAGSGGRGWGEQRGHGHPQGEQRRGQAVWQRARLRSGTLDLMA